MRFYFQCVFASIALFKYVRIIVKVGGKTSVEFFFVSALCCLYDDLMESYRTVCV